MDLTSKSGNIMAQPSKARTWNHSLDRSSSVSLREETFEGLDQTGKGAIPLGSTLLSPVTDIMLQSLRDRDPVGSLSGSLDFLGMLLELILADFVILHGILDNTVTEVLVLGEESIKAGKLLGVLQLLLEQLFACKG